MRDILHVGGLFAVFFFLVTRYPSVVPVVRDADVVRQSFASFVTFSPAANAACLEKVRTSWQVRSKARGRPSIGRLDSDVPLLLDTLPPPAATEFALIKTDDRILPTTDASTYAFLPQTKGADLPEFALGTQKTRLVHSRESQKASQTFNKNDMISIDTYETLKEYMK